MDPVLPEDDARAGFAVISPSAREAEVLSTALVVEGAAGFRWLHRFPACEAAVFESGSPALVSERFLERFTPHEPIQ